MYLEYRRTAANEFRTQLAEDAPALLAEITAALSHRSRRLRVTVDDLPPDADVLYAFLWYAAGTGVTVTVLPVGEERRLQ